MSANDGGRTEVRVVIAGGGTGGHLAPAIALGRELAGRGVDVLLVGGVRGPDRTLLPASGLAHRLAPAPAVERRRWWRNVGLPVALARAVAGARRTLAEVRPDVVVGTGGYVSVPIGLAARLRGTPLLLQEQNSRPGLATRLLARWAARVCVAYEDVAARLPAGAVVERTGNPIEPPRAEPVPFADRLDPDRPTLGVFGGSQGATAINAALLELYATDPGRAPNLVWQTGERDLARVREAADWPRRVVVEPFFSPMGGVYPALDLVVCRAGAMTLAEVTAWGLPAVLVPYPHATADHQTANARALEAAGAAVVVPQAVGLGSALAGIVGELLADPGRRSRMAEAARRLARPDAARAVADRVLELAGAPA